ncbi:hypothetical protein GCM10027036_08400 [Flavihumibacter cheonanensis]|uniref:helix-turn-helix domain-containing protein n=1 Tax=Flavihumibacter cheonanensis TaxID=1442385 RepID=UPI001EF83E36|nr:AraC family transcriptional regulator [Flavihumibacter cheonanensis]MCG7751720.1 AraC family transcriptional regulator [Flavihumibacter cheonanensis]
MNSIQYNQKSNIFFSCTEQEYKTVENNIAETVVIHIYSGSLSVTDGNGSYLVQEGETALFYRNMLAKFVKYPAKDKPFTSVAIAFSQVFLEKYYLSMNFNTIVKPVFEVHKLSKHPLLNSLFDSILPYYQLDQVNLPSLLTDLKLQEAITVLRTVDAGVDNQLANFAVQGKLDLVDYMQKNYVFNIPLERFAYLTGRSLATFKRDFQRLLGTTPQKWLLEKRLKEAHFLISQKKQKPSDVYLEVGFENLSHFSRSFKQHFGYNPSKLEMSYSAK